MEKEELKNEVQDLMRSELYTKATEAFDYYVDETGISRRYLNQGAPSEVENEELNDAVDEFMDNIDPDPDNLREQIQDFLDNEYPMGYLYQEIERYQNQDEIREEMTDDLLLFLNNTEPYGVHQSDELSRYWQRGAANIPSLSEFAKYLSEDGIVSFVEKYCPDWEEVA